jgi:hypothetical protein
MPRYLTCKHCGSRYRAPKAPKAVPADDMSIEVFRALAWLRFWNEAGQPKDWRGCGFGLKFGDGLTIETGKAYF